MPKIFVTKQIPGEHLEKLKAGSNEVLIGEPLEKIKDSDALLTLLTDRVDGDLMDAAGPQLKVIANYAVGFDNIDIKAANDRGIVVANTPCDEVNEAVAEHTWALILALARRIVESDEFVRDQGYFAGRGGYQGWDPNLFLGTNLIGKTLGIIGLGRIGSMVARRAKGYNMTLLYNKREPDPEAEKELGVKFESLDNLLAASDFVSLHVPLTEETRHLIDKNALAKMKKGAFLVNTARGAVVFESDLIEALKSGHLGGAALDVFEQEPEISQELKEMPNVILTPHIASATWEARNKMGELAVSAILETLAGCIPENIVNKEAWGKKENLKTRF